MTIQFIGSTVASGNSATASSTYPSGIKHQDLLLACVSLGVTGVLGAATITTPSGWTNIEDATDTGTISLSSSRLAIYYKYRGASDSDSSQDFTLSTTNEWVATVAVYRYAGDPVTPATPFTVEVASTTETATLGDTTHATGTANNSDAKSWVVSAFTLRGSTTDVTEVGSGFTTTERQDGTNGSTRGVWVDSNAAATTGNKSCTYTSGSGDCKLAWIALLNNIESVDTSEVAGLTDLRSGGGVALSVTSVRSDVQGPTDARTGLSQQKWYQNSEGLTDSRASSIQKTSTDVVVPTDTSRFTRTLSRSDLQGPLDPYGLSQFKYKSDSSTPTDTVINKTQQKFARDTENVSDTNRFSVTKYFSYASGLVDSLMKSLYKQVVNDSGSVDRQELARGKQITDNSGMYDYDLVGPYSRLHIAGGEGGGLPQKIYHIDVSDGTGMMESNASDGGHETISSEDSIFLWDSFYLHHVSYNEITTVEFNGTDPVVLNDGVALSRVHDVRDIAGTTDSTVITFKPQIIYSIDVTDSSGMNDFAFPVSVDPGTSATYGNVQLKWTFEPLTKKWVMTLV